jgi:hypothetical protein
MRSVVCSAGFLGALLLPGMLWSQQPELTRAFELERRGDYAAAVETYRSVLANKPADLAALLGLERSLLPLNRSREILPLLGAAMTAAPKSSVVYGIALRAWAAFDQPDSVRAIAERWARVAPTEETPYREWGSAELGRQNRAGAREAYLRGRERLGRADALAAELAQLALAEGDYSAALAEWLLAVRRLPSYRITAVITLGDIPERARPGVLQLLTTETDQTSRWIEAELRARWGDPLGGLRVLLAALPAERPQAIAALRSMLDQLRTSRSPDAKEAQGRVLEALAERSSNIQAGRLRIEAAQAYSAAGNRTAARRMLGDLADAPGAPGSIPTGAAATLIGVLVAEGKLEDATRRLPRLRTTISADEYEHLRRGVAVGWLRAGELERADSIISADTSIEGLALSGRIRLYRGDIKGAIQRFRAAGPYTGDRAEATRRTGLLALLQPLEVDSLAQLGHALYQLERGDTTQAIAGLSPLADTLPPQNGGAELHFLVGRLLTVTGRPVEAERAFRAAARAGSTPAAPAAELALAELLLANQRPGEAVDLLEHLILTYPQSALIPQARRKLDEARGAVPKT